MKQLYYCVISYFFQLHLMLHACVRRFDVTDTIGNFWKLNMALENLKMFVC